MQRESLFPQIRGYVQSILNGYIQHESITTSKIDTYIVPSQWKNNAGIIGALSLAQLALLRKSQSDVLGFEDSVNVAGPVDSRANATGYGYVQVTPQVLRHTEDRIDAAMERLQAQISDLKQGPAQLPGIAGSYQSELLALIQTMKEDAAHRQYALPVVIASLFLATAGYMFGRYASKLK